jgi:REP element-mobilizing transposase RayT
MDHKSQKRIYFEGAEYFVTFNTQDRIKYFVEPIFCEVFVACLRMSKIFYKYDLYAFVVLLNHAHLLFLPHEAKDLSKIMKYLKRHITRNINFILGYSTEEAIGQSPLRLAGEYKEYRDKIEKINQLMRELKQKFIKKYGQDQNIFPKLKWQKSFRDHYIRNHKDFDEHVKYIYNNPAKHKVANPENYKYIFTNYPELITEI